MERLTISCETCDRSWSLGTSLSFYEQQALESRPCPHCGSYTLTCHDNDDDGAAAKSVTWRSYCA